jgi:hypothetical protein
VHAVFKKKAKSDSLLLASAGKIAHEQAVTDEHKQPGVAFWATVVLVIAVMLAYPLSLGPAVWLYHHKYVPNWARMPIQVFYSPLEWLAHHGPGPVRDSFNWYVELWVAK